MGATSSSKLTLPRSAICSTDSPGHPSSGAPADTPKFRQPSSSDAGGDWRDRWRARPEQSAPVGPARGQFSHLPPPGITQSSPWPSDGTRSALDELRERYTYRRPSQSGSGEPRELSRIGKGDTYFRWGF